MKKIPTLFKKIYDENGKYIGVTQEVTAGMEWVLVGEGEATIKYDGSACAFIDGLFYKRYDAKKGKKPPKGAIPCCEPDELTDHHPHWVKISAVNPSDKWFVDAFIHTDKPLWNGTYEAIGPHFQGNPYKLQNDTLIKHGETKVIVERTYDGIRKFVVENDIEGLVFWKDGEPKCKIRKKDFGEKWSGGKVPFEF